MIICCSRSGICFRGPAITDRSGVRRNIFLLEQVELGDRVKVFFQGGFGVGKAVPRIRRKRMLTMAREEVNLLLLFAGKFQERIRDVFFICGLNDLFFAISFQDNGPVGLYFVAACDFRLGVRVHELVFDVLVVVAVRIQKVLYLVLVLSAGTAGRNEDFDRYRLVYFLEDIAGLSGKAERSGLGEVHPQRFLFGDKNEQNQDGQKNNSRNYGICAVSPFAVLAFICLGRPLQR